MRNFQIAIFFLLVCISRIANADTIPLDNAALEFKLPNHWHYFGRDKSISDKIVHIFKRDYIVNQNGVKIIPAILVMNENTEAEDSVVYLINKQMQFNLKNVSSYYTWHDSKTQMKQAIILQSTNYNSQAQKTFSSVILTSTYGNHGLTVYCNVTSDSFDEVRDEFFSILKSIKIETKLAQDEIVEFDVTDDKGRHFIQMMSNRDTSEKSRKKVTVIKTNLPK